ncbi:hypothetical protein ABPG77_009286 [Micractinium sp. CCAP 211/92]
MFARFMLLATLACLAVVNAYEGDGTAYSAAYDKDATGFNACGFGKLPDRPSPAFSWGPQAHLVGVGRLRRVRHPPRSSSDSGSDNNNDSKNNDKSLKTSKDSPDEASGEAEKVGTYKKWVVDCDDGRKRCWNLECMNGARTKCCLKHNGKICKEVDSVDHSKDIEWEDDKPSKPSDSVASCACAEHAVLSMSRSPGTHGQNLAHPASFC